MRGLSMATPRSYCTQPPKNGTLLRALRPDDRALPSRPRVSPHAHHTRSPPAACESARTARASLAPLALGPRLAASARSPLHRARHVYPSPHAVLGGGLCGTPSHLVTRTREGRGSRVPTQRILFGFAGHWRPAFPA